MSGYLTVSFFCFGVLIVLTYAWQRFNEPSFPNEETLPRTVEPLRYLFLKPAYAKARLLYLVGLLCWSFPASPWSERWVGPVPRRVSHRKPGPCRPRSF
jgi:hypothetical protein